MIALALDPGVTTGIAIGLLEENKLSVAVDQKVFKLSELYDYFTWFRPYDPYVIYEDFQYRNAPRMGLDLTPVKMIGIIEMFAEMTHETDKWYYKQTAAQGKGFFSDEKLKGLGVYAVGKQHGRDATRHLLQWLQFGAGSRYAVLNNPNVSIEMIEPGPMYDRIRE